LVVIEAQVRAAMVHYEAVHGRGDGVAICRELAKLADLLGSLWYAKKQQALVPAATKVALLLLQASVVPAPQQQ